MNSTKELFVDIKHDDETVSHALTHPQERVWQVERLFPGTPLHNLAGTATYRMNLDFAALEAAFHRLVKAHDATRLRLIETPNGEIRQRIATYEPFTLPIRDFSKERDPRAAFQSWLEQQCRRPFEPHRGGSLFRVEFFRVSPEECGYFANGHHIVSDGWSFQVLAGFVSRAYRECIQERWRPEATLPSYLELASDERRYAGSELFENSRRFWLDEMRDAPRYPTDTAGTIGKQVRFRIPRQRAGELRRHAVEMGASISTLFMALMFVYLWRRERRNDLVIAMPLANRSGQRKRAFGMFASTMPVRMKLRDDERLADFVNRMQRTLRACFRHQRYPYNLLLEELRTKGHRQPLFRTCVNFYNTKPEDAARIGDEIVTVDECYTGHQLFPLYLIIKEWSADDGIELDVNYKPSLFSQKDMAELPGLLLEAASWTAANDATLGQILRRVSPAVEIGAEPPPALHSRHGMSVVGSHQPVEGDMAATHFPTTRHRTDASSAGTGSATFEEIPLDIPPPLRERLQASFGPEPESFASAMAAIVCLLLARCCSVEQVAMVVAGAPESGDSARAVRATVAPEQTFGALRESVRRELRAGARHDATNHHGVSLHFDGASWLAPGSSPVRLALGVGGDKIAFDASIYERCDIELLAARWTHTLEALATSPQTKLRDIEILGDAERRMVLDTFNETKASFDERTTIVQLFEKTATRLPDSMALRTRADSWSYARLNQRANQLARTLRAKGIGRGSIVPVMLERSPELLVGILGILKAGGAYLPIDPSYPSSRVAFLLEDCGASLAVSTSSLLESTEDRHVVSVHDEGAYDPDVRNLVAVSGPTDLAYVCYTSGSTGQPKGAMIEHRSLVNRLHWMQRAYPLTSKDVLLQKTSISFDVSIWELLWWGTVGASLSLLPPGDEKSPERLLEHIEEHEVTVLHFVPSMLQAFLTFTEHERAAGKLRSLRRVFASGEALRPEHVDAFYRIFDGLGVRLTNLYGPTEATIDVTFYDCPPAETCSRVPIGRPIDNTVLRILSEASALQPVGTAGELYIGGVGVARGYWNRAELTESRFVVDPYRDGEKLYRTGDFARWLPNGEVEFLGRRDNQVKIRGFRIELGEIEAALRRHPQVTDAAVVVRDSGQGHTRLDGYVVLAEDCTVEQVREHLASRLPEYMVPSSLQKLGALPLGPNGKVDRHALPRSIRTGALEPLQTPSERALAEVWRDTLGTSEIGALDNFFALGGDSIKIISLLTKAKARKQHFTTQDVYRHPVLRELAKVIRSTDAADVHVRMERFQLLHPEDRAALPPTAEDAYPLGALQAGLIYQSQIIRETPFYHDVFSYRIRGPFDRAKFAVATRELCRNHDMFRTTFHVVGFSEPLQIVHREVHDVLEVVDLRGSSPQEQDQSVEQYVAELRNKRFDWQVPGLIGFHVHVLSDFEYLYTIDFHDSALDGWSVNLIHRELFEAYFALLDGKPIRPRETTLAFRDFVTLERDALASEEAKDFWAHALDDSTFVALPRWPHERATASGVSFHEVRLPNGLSDRIKDVANALAVPAKTVLLAAHVHVLSVLTGEDDVITGYEYGGRPEASDGENVIGLFLNTLPLRIAATSNRWSDLVERIHRAETDFIPYRRYPMAQMKRDRGARNLLFETVFNFTHFHVLRGLKDLPGFDLTEVKVRAETEFVFRAEFSVHPFSEQVLFWIHYHADVFPPEQIEAIGRLYVRALEGIIRDPSAEPRSASLLSDDERRQQLHGFNAPEKPLPEGTCLHHVFAQHVANTPHRIAASCGAEHWTFERLDQASNLIARALEHLAPTPDHVVAVAMDRGLPWMATMLACFKVGCAYLPLDLEHPEERIASILSRSECSILIAGDAVIADKMARAGALAATLRTDVSREVRLLLADRILREPLDAGPPTRTVSPSNLAYVIFTSGSTGTPKGAMIEHGSMLNHLLSKVEDLGLTSRDVIAQNASQCFDISLWQLLAGLLVGARVVLYPNATIGDVETFFTAVRRDAISILEVVPSYLSVMLQLLERIPRPLEDLRSLLVTGEPVKVELVERWFAAYPAIPVINAYGPTEAADDICHHIMTEAPKSALVPVGKPIRNMNVYVLDERRELVPVGTGGEVCVSGVGVGRGYLNDAERTQAAFVEDPFRPGYRMYRTGDVGRWLPNGLLELAGRKDDQIKLRGYRIETGEIEGALQKCEDVKEAAVLPDRKNATLVAFVVSERELDTQRLRGELARHLPDYMIPSRFVRLSALPLTAHGKVAKQKLVAHLAGLGDHASHLQPLTGPTERDLARLWAQVLKIDVSRIGSNSDFFELGGHSLKAMELSLRADDSFSINDIFKFPVLGELARRIESRAGHVSELLVDYSARANEPRFSIVAFTYAGGNASNFKPLFDSLHERSRAVGCYAIELPRSAEGNVESVAKLCVDEIRRRVRTPMALWGHCSGSALTLEVARLLEEEHIELQRVFLGGKVIQSRPRAKLREVLARFLSRFMTVDVSAMSSDQIKTWMIDKTGFEGFRDLSENDTRFITDAFRQDASSAARYIARIHDGDSGVRIHAPIVNVVANDDPLTKGYRRKYKNWHLVSERVRLRVLEDGGHYFIKTRASQTAELILRELQEEERQWSIL